MPEQPDAEALPMAGQVAGGMAGMPLRNMTSTSMGREDTGVRNLT